MRGVTMEKIDWKNLSYDDFTGFVAVTAILLFVLYFGGLWYTTYDYRIQMRDQMVEMYQQLPNPIPPIEDDYGVHQRWLVFYIDGVKVLNKPQPENVINEYKKALEKEGWATEREYEHVRNAYKGYIEEFKTHNHTYYEFKKVDNSVDYKKEYEVRKNNFTEYFQSNSDVFLESLKEINNYKQKLSNYFANGINDNISTIVTSFNRMLDEVVVQKYLFSKLFELPSEYSVVIDETIRLWKAIRAIVTKSMFKKSITDKSLEMLNEMFDKQYKNECERLQMLMSNIA